jgi:hypothetical protein
MAILCFNNGIFGVILLLSMTIRYINAFVTPRAFSAVRALSLNTIPPTLTEITSSMTLSGAEALPEMEPAALTPSELNDAAVFVDKLGEGLRGISFGIIGVVAVIAGIAFFVANFLIPQAAAEVEAQVKKKYPDLWREYEVKLEPGEVLAMRPDLIQELGNKMRQMDLEEFKRMERDAQNQVEVKNDNIVDVEVISKEESDKE